MIKNNKKSIVIIGHYGKDNLGDESILTVLLHYLGKERCVVLGLDKNKIEKLHNTSACNLMSIMSVLAIFKSNHVIFGGGALLKNTSLFKLSPFLIISKLFGKNIIFFGIDVYPLKSIFKPLLKWCINNNTLICVRNNNSVSNLKKIGIEQTTYVCDDLAFMLPEVLEISSIKKEDTKNKIIGINLRPSTFADKFDINELLDKTKKQVFKILLEQPSSILLIPTQPIDEKILSDFAISIKKDCNVEVNWSNHNYNILEALKSIKNCDLIVGMRYHSLVFAKIMNVPFIAISYSQKVETFARDCKDEVNYESGEKYLGILKECTN